MTINNFSPSQLEERLINFASEIIILTNALPKSFAAKHLSSQIIRSGTSPALNYGEVRAAESAADFLHKIKICLKELRETYVCLKIIEKQRWLPNPTLLPLLKESNELVSIFVATSKTAQKRI